MEMYKLSLLGFYLNGAVDSRNYDDISIQTIAAKIQDRTIFQYLKENINLDLFFLNYDDRKELENEWLNIWNVVQQDRKLLVHNSGLCLLISYLFEGIQDRLGLKISIKSSYPIIE